MEEPAIRLNYPRHWNLWPCRNSPIPAIVPCCSSLGGRRDNQVVISFVHSLQVPKVE